MSRFVMLSAVAALAVSACATQRTYQEPPHHFSKDADGNRLACYPGAVENEYECVPVTRRYGYAPRSPYYDPFWPHSTLYAWPYERVIVIRDAPRQPPPHFRPRKDER